jgi:hypothetical protein
MAFAESKDSRSEWPMSGQNVQNTASNDEEREISTSNVATLAPKWVATTGGDVSARAAVVGGLSTSPTLGAICGRSTPIRAPSFGSQLSTIFGLRPRTVVSRKGDAAAVAQCFTENAVVKDEGHTYNGVDEIRRRFAPDSLLEQAGFEL